MDVTILFAIPKETTRFAKFLLFYHPRYLSTLVTIYEYSYTYFSTLILDKFRKIIPFQETEK